LTVSVNETQQMGLMRGGYLAGSFSGHEGRSPKRRYIFRHWGPERYASKHTSKKVKWFSQSTTIS